MRWMYLLFLLSTAEGFLSPSSGTRISNKKQYQPTVEKKDDLRFSGDSRLHMAMKESPTSSFKLPNRSRRTKHKDAVIIGSGLAGLSVALYLSQLDPDRKITVVDKQEADIEAKKTTTIASFAAAGMLAPQSERLPKGHLLNICLASRKMYPEFCDLVESMAKESGEEGAKYLMHNKGDANMDPWSIGYMASGGFLAPAFAGDSVATWAPPDDGGSATWLDEIQVRELEPNLHRDVVGGWWFPEDASVDARRLTCSLYAACVGAGVEFLCGKNYEVTSLDLNDGQCHGLWLKNGDYLKTKSALVANGAWMRNLLPVPVEPHKGQSLSLVMPKDRPPILRRVLFAQDCYIVPKEDGKIVIGATVEAGSFDGDVTPAGLLHILTHALQLVPGLKDLPLAETWAGLRPTTPDKGPILGKSPWKNLFLAGGYWRNGVLLAPKTAQLLACLMSGTELTKGDQELLHAFSWDRFTEKGGGAKLAANARYAASMHPIHSRKSGTGVAAAVGTELGSYSTAKTAREERERDRSALWYEGSDESFERAAALGTRDASAFYFGDDDDDNKVQEQSNPVQDHEATETSSLPSEDTTISSESLPEPESQSSNNMASVYQSIKSYKAKQGMKLPEGDSTEDNQDPGFRIYHKDSTTGESREVPPYSSPGEFLQSIGKGDDASERTTSDSSESASVPENKEDSVTAEVKSQAGDDYSEKTFDGYQAILEANAGKSREQEMESMRQARIKNRFGQSSIDESKIGAEKVDDLPEMSTNLENSTEVNGKEKPTDVKSVYEAIQANKAKKKMSLLDSNDAEDKPDPGFRIYHVDSATGESCEVPPYTSPGEFLQSVQKSGDKTSAAGKVVNGSAHSAVEEKGTDHAVTNGSELSTSEINEKTYVESDDCVKVLGVSAAMFSFLFYFTNIGVLLSCPVSSCYDYYT